MSELEIYKGMVKKMKDDEIKEKLKLIDGFFNKAWACDLDEVYHAVIDTITNLQHIKDLYNQLLKDYDELQQENERLQINLGLKQFIKHTDMNFCKLEDELEDYKSRCEKAVEYMNNTFNIREVKDMFDIMNKLEDILNGRSDE